MQVNFNPQVSYNQYFGMAVIINPAQENEVTQYIDKLPYEQRVKISLARLRQRDNTPNVILSLVRRLGKDRLRASVGNKDYTQGFFHNAAETVCKASSDVEKIMKNQIKYVK